MVEPLPSDDDRIRYCRDCGKAGLQWEADLRKFNAGFSACCGTRLLTREEYSKHVSSAGSRYTEAT